MTTNFRNANNNRPGTAGGSPKPNGIEGAPVERFRGEVTNGERVGDPGDLEEDTLDKDAPFNKTHGLRDEDPAADQK